jgi:uncharacterized membrane protein YfcA
MIYIDFIVALAIGALTGLGVGSGGLFLVYLTLALGVEQIKAQGLNLAFFILSAFSSAFVNIKRKRVDFRIFLFVITFGIFGVFVGSLLLPLVSTDIIRTLFGGLLIILSVITFFQKPKKENKRSTK